MRSLIDFFLHNKTGRIIMSVLWGLGLAFMFFMQVCDGPNCIVLKAPPKSFEKGIYEHLGECYAFVAEVSNCDKCPVKTNPSRKDQGGKCYKK